LRSSHKEEFEVYLVLGRKPVQRFSYSSKHGRPQDFVRRHNLFFFGGGPKFEIVTRPFLTRRKHYCLMFGGVIGEHVASPMFADTLYTLIIAVDLA